MSHDRSVERLNALFAHKLSPLKFGGMFHTGVEVDGLEWFFGSRPKNTKNNALTGVSCVKPRRHPDHHYRQTIELGVTSLDPSGVDATIGQIIKEYLGKDYDLLRRNCCHFAEDLCQRLGVRGIPPWVHRLAQIGASLDEVFSVVKILGL